VTQDFVSLIDDMPRTISTAMASKGLSIGEACRRLGVPEKTLRAMMADGRLGYRRVNRGLGTPGHIVISATDIARLLAPSSPPAAETYATLRNSRMGAVVKAINKHHKRGEILRSWTGQDLQAEPPSNESEPGGFRRQCRFAGG
jgi:excisionase family DNA binding protein